MIYTVQKNDTPLSIAQRLTGNGGNARALVGANPQKATMVNQGVVTFKNLSAGETIALPPSWGLGALGGFLRQATATKRIVGLGAFGLGDLASLQTLANAIVEMDGQLAQPRVAVLAFQQAYNAAIGTGVVDANGAALGPALSTDGEYGTNTAAAVEAIVGSVAVPTAIANGGFGAENGADLANWMTQVSADTTLCNGSPNDNALAFQVTYNKVQGGSLSQDGLWGTNSANAASSIAGTTVGGATMPASPPAACAAYATGGSPSPAPAPSPAPGGGGTVPIPPITITSTAGTSSTGTVVAVLGVAAAAAIGGYAYLHYKKHGTAVPSAIAKRLPTRGGGARRMARA